MPHTGDILVKRDMESELEQRMRERTRELEVANWGPRASERTLARELDAAQRFQHVATQLINGRVMEVLYEQILDTALAILHFDFATIQMFYPERGTNGELRLLGHRGFSAEAAKHWEWVRPAKSTICGEALRTGQRIAVRDVRKCDFLAESNDLEVYLAPGIQASQTTPLFSRAGALLGMVSTHWCEPHELSASESHALDVLARLAADSIERLRAEEALWENQQRLASIYDTLRDVIFHLAVEPEGQFLFVSVNAAFLRVTGLSREAVVGKTVKEVIPEPSLTMVLEKYRQAVEKKATVSWEETSDYPSGRLTGEVSVAPVFDSNGRCSHLVGSVHDITDRKQAEAERERLWAQLAWSQKMESLGRLAGGLAHDFNNLMSVVLMNAESALDELRCGESAVDSVTTIRETADRAVELGQQLLTFSSKKVLQSEAVDLNSFVAQSQAFVGRLIGENVKVVFKPGSVLGLVRPNRGELGQILMNLAVNSRDAMPEGGTLTIETTTVEFDESSAPLSPDAKPGGYAMLAVSDTGIGMDQETQARAFEPFFTTKGVGKGTGLGLSLVYGIVKQSGGFIIITSEPGHGTEFKIYLPVIMEMPEPIPDNGEDPIKGGSETILLVEDEAALREKSRDVLQKAGYRVLVAGDGKQAIALALEETGSIDLLLTDVMMPEMSGTRLSESLRSLHPETKVLYMSGYPNAADASFDLQSQSNFFQKPFTIKGLLRRVREVLEGETPQGGECH